MLSSFALCNMSPIWGRLFVPCTHAVSEQCTMNMLTILFLSEKLQWRKRWEGDVTKNAGAANDDTEKVELKVFHQCLRCEFISHADVLDRKPLPGACSSCRYWLSGLARNLRTVAIRPKSRCTLRIGFLQKWFLLPGKCCISFITSALLYAPLCTVSVSNSLESQLLKQSFASLI